MALKPILNTEFKINSVVFKDTTDFYDVQYNPSGWGSPNIERNETILATVEMTSNNFSIVFDVTSYINSNDNVLNLGEYEHGLSDGIFELTYKIQTIDNIYSNCFKTFSMRNIDCCIDKKIEDIIKYEDDRLYMNKVMALSAYRDALYKSALCMNEERIAYFLNKLNNICNPCATATQ